LMVLVSVSHFSCVLQESRSLDPAQRRDPRKRESDLRRRRMSLWLKEKETEIPAYAMGSFASAGRVTHVLVQPTHKPKFRCVRDLGSRENCEIAPKLDPRGGPPNARSRRFRDKGFGIGR